MKNLKTSIFILFTLITVLIGCQNSGILDENNSENGMLQIKPRTTDPGCTVCANIPAPHCCCFVENFESTESSLDLHICGVIGSGYGTDAETCHMFIANGQPCEQVGNQGVHRIVAYQGRLYFCIASGAPFSIYNANGSGRGRIRVGCSGTDMPAGTIGLDLDYGTGGYARYFTTSGCDVDFPCSY